MANAPSISTLEDVKKLGTILGVWAHPDDESFSCGGIIAAAIRNGQSVICVTATKGEAGIQDSKRWPADQLGEIRASEMKAAMKELGITQHRWLDFADGCCDKVDCQAAVDKVAAIIEQCQPNSILTFGPDGMTGHPDHQTVCKWAHLAVQQSGCKASIYHAVQSKQLYDQYLKQADEQFNIFFNIDEPPLREEDCCDICFRLTPELIDTKLRALKAMPSQTEAMLSNLPADQLEASFGTECFERATTKVD